MLIVLLSVQFYRDVLPVFTQGDSFMKKNYIIATKKISALGSFTGRSNTFSPKEIEEMKEQFSPKAWAPSPLPCLKYPQA